MRRWLPRRLLAVAAVVWIAIGCSRPPTAAPDRPSEAAPRVYPLSAFVDSGELRGFALSEDGRTAWASRLAPRSDWEVIEIGLGPGGAMRPLAPPPLPGLRLVDRLAVRGRLLFTTSAGRADRGQLFLLEPSGRWLSLTPEDSDDEILGRLEGKARWLLRSRLGDNSPADLFEWSAASLERSATSLKETELAQVLDRASREAGWPPELGPPGRWATPRGQNPLTAALAAGTETFVFGAGGDRFPADLLVGSLAGAATRQLTYQLSARLDPNDLVEARSRAGGGSLWLPHPALERLDRPGVVWIEEGWSGVGFHPFVQFLVNRGYRVWSEAAQDDDPQVSETRVAAARRELIAAGASPEALTFVGLGRRAGLAALTVGSQPASRFAAVASGFPSGAPLSRETLAARAHGSLSVAPDWVDALPLGGHRPRLLLLVGSGDPRLPPLEIERLLARWGTAPTAAQAQAVDGALAALESRSARADGYRRLAEWLEATTPAKSNRGEEPR